MIMLILVHTSIRDTPHSYHIRRLYLLNRASLG